MAKFKLTLDDPIEIEGRTITEVTIRTPKVREVREMARLEKEATDEIDAAVGMVLTLSDLSSAAVEELNTSDLFKIANEIAGFFDKGVAQATGGA